MSQALEQIDDFRDRKERFTVGSHGGLAYILFNEDGLVRNHVALGSQSNVARIVDYHAVVKAARDAILEGYRS